MLEYFVELPSTVRETQRLQMLKNLEGGGFESGDEKELFWEAIGIIRRQDHPKATPMIDELSAEIVAMKTN